MCGWAARSAACRDIGLSPISELTTAAAVGRLQDASHQLAPCGLPSQRLLLRFSRAVTYLGLPSPANSSKGEDMTVWREAQDLRGARVDDELIDSAEHLLGPEDQASGDPQVLYVMPPTTVQLPYETWRWPIGLLVTRPNLVFVRRKGLTRRLDCQIRPLRPPSVWPQSTGPNTYRIRFDHTPRPDPSVLRNFSRSRGARYILRQRLRAPAVDSASTQRLDSSHLEHSGSSVTACLSGVDDGALGPSGKAGLVDRLGQVDRAARRTAGTRRRGVTQRRGATPTASRRS